MITRTIRLNERMHAVLMHALDCAGCWSFEDGWACQEVHMLGLNRIAEPLECPLDLRKLINICKAAKISELYDAERVSQAYAERTADELVGPPIDNDVTRAFRGKAGA